MCSEFLYLLVHKRLTSARLSQQSVPPVMAFHLGSLGFLTPFKFDNFQEQVNAVLEGENCHRGLNDGTGGTEHDGIFA